MKLLTTIAVIFSAQLAMADTTPETFMLNVVEGISKCTTVNGQESCPSGAFTSNEIPVLLSNCIEIPGSYWTCTGTWQDIQSQDGYNFINTVTVTKTLNVPVEAKVEASAQYRITASTAPTWSTKTPISITLTLGQLGVLTDSVSFNGEEFVVSNSTTSYQPNLTVGPLPNVTPAAGLKSRK
jgi:hypothetical protein